MKVTKMGWPVLALVVIVGLMGTTAMAQPPGGPGGRGPGGPPHGFRHGPHQGGPGGGLGRLLYIAEVRAELDLSGDQVNQLQALEGELREKFGKQMGDRSGRRGGPGAKGRKGHGKQGKGKKGKGKQGSGNKGPGDKGPSARGERGPDAGGPANREEMQARMKEVRAEVEGRLAEILTEEQMTRLKEIAVQAQLQRGGPHALVRGPVGDALALSDEQKTSLKDRAKELRGEMVEKIKALHKESHAQLLVDVLTSEQREQLDVMRGEDFDLPAPARFDRRGGKRCGMNCGPDGCRKGGPPHRGRGPGRKGPGGPPAE